MLEESVLREFAMLYEERRVRVLARTESPTRPKTPPIQILCLNIHPLFAIPSPAFNCQGIIYSPCSFLCIFLYSLSRNLTNTRSSFPNSTPLPSTPCQDVFLWLQTSQQSGNEAGITTMYEQALHEQIEQTLTEPSATPPSIFNSSTNFETQITIGLPRPSFANPSASHSST